MLDKTSKSIKYEKDRNIVKQIRKLEDLIIELQRKLDDRTIPCLEKRNYFINYNEDYSVIWYLDKYVMNWTRGETLTDIMLIELFEETKDELFLDLLQYRVISRVVKSSGGSITRKSNVENEINIKSLVIEDTDEYTILNF